METVTKDADETRPQKKFLSLSVRHRLSQAWHFVEKTRYQHEIGASSCKSEDDIDNSRLETRLATGLWTLKKSMGDIEAKKEEYY